MDKEAQERIAGIIAGTHSMFDERWAAATADEFYDEADVIISIFYNLGYRRVICPECGHIRDEDRVRNGMKCEECAGYGDK